MKAFYLLRDGIGVVAEVIEFSNGKVAMCWQTEPGSIAVFDSLEELEEIHGHGGKSRVVESVNDSRHDQN